MNSSAASSSVGFANSFVDFFVYENSHPVLRNWFLVREFFKENFCLSSIPISSLQIVGPLFEFLESNSKSSTMFAAI